MRYFSLTLLAVTLTASLALLADAHSQLQVFPLKSLAVGPHPDSVEARSLDLEKRQQNLCPDPMTPNQCGNYCCQVMVITKRDISNAFGLVRGLSRLICFSIG